MPSTPGPIPKRSDQRRRVNAPEIPVDTAESKPVYEIPKSDPSWHEGARRWYDALGKSGQSVWYEESDWATAWVWAKMLSDQLLSTKPNSMVISAWGHAASELLTTEGARRRARIELAKADKVDQDAVNAAAGIADIRERLAG